MPKIRKSLLLYFLIILGIILLVKLLTATWNWRQVDVRLRQEEERISEVEEKNKQLKAKLEEVKSEEFMEKIAREKLGMGKEGEVIVIMPQIDYKKAKKEKQELENWEKWMRVLFY